MVEVAEVLSGNLYLSLECVDRDRCGTLQPVLQRAGQSIDPLRKTPILGFNLLLALFAPATPRVLLCSLAHPLGRPRFTDSVPLRRGLRALPVGPAASA